MFDFYTRFYQAVATSAANAEYCERVYGRNLCLRVRRPEAPRHLIEVAGPQPAAMCSTSAAATA